jgi:predicted phage tail protein
MTDIFLHGKLGQEFGQKFRFSICKPKDVFQAIETIKEGFSKKIVELSKSGLQYSIIVDGQSISSEKELERRGKFSQIDIVPVIFGSGVAALAVGFVAAIGSYAAAGAGYALLSSFLMSVAFSAIAIGIQALMAKPPSYNTPQGSVSTTSSSSKSFMFSNRENVAFQGSPVPLGYGRIRVGSAIIQENVKSYPNSMSTFDEFASQSVQQGGSHMSIIHNQEL